MRMSAILALLGALLPWAASAEPAGLVTRIQGEAEAHLPGGVHPLTEGGGIEAGWEIATGPQARLEIRFADGTVLTLGERALLRIDSFVYRPAEGKGDILLDVARGAFLVASGAVADLPGKPLKVVTPIATIGIRGTVFWGGSLDALLDVLVLEGAVVVENMAGRVEIEAGEGTSLPAPDSRAFPVLPPPPPPPSRWTAERIERAARTVSFER